VSSIGGTAAIIAATSLGDARIVGEEAATPLPELTGGRGAAGGGAAGRAGAGACAAGASGANIITVRPPGRVAAAAG
jgi:hypothetical protein